jgi:hypothetical protein
MFNDLLPIPDPRPSKAHPDHRAKRKEIEREHPHFNTKELGLKAGVLALLAGIALFPWEKKYDEHVKEHHPERLEKGNRDKERRKSEPRRRDGDGDPSGRRSEGGRHRDDRRRSADWGREARRSVDRRR